MSRRGKKGGENYCLDRPREGGKEKAPCPGGKEEATTIPQPKIKKKLKNFFWFGGGGKKKGFFVIREKGPERKAAILSKKGVLNERKLPDHRAWKRKEEGRS